ncbi:MAG: SPOR domain-containing protein [Ignavibacteriales bacterium]|nr:MAG: SPOR domain-containing protein [Ignavibacteriaceae bacterium]MBW7872271.1 SPOR domain-containing protein [Ignavibacteria bacterium]MCZ2142553.1 SPOR domain-containing protein [Ignavibacteriales bacterium]OQY75240.1 MAG: hypothetical protein B6D45_05870 [Ignavibacteriales bacterium UTCHB3]MBV6445582.1 hypothetical protein [Ignavibacteriaceae bacterium]
MRTASMRTAGIFILWLLFNFVSFSQDKESNLLTPKPKGTVVSNDAALSSENAVNTEQRVPVLHTVSEPSVPWTSYQSENLSPNIVRFYYNGFRVSLGSADSETEALSIKKELAIKLGIDILEIYKEKDTYSLKVGDFYDEGSAALLMYQLRQLGFSKAKIIANKVNVF